MSGDGAEQHIGSLQHVPPLDDGAGEPLDTCGRRRGEGGSEEEGGRSKQVSDETDERLSPPATLSLTQDRCSVDNQMEHEENEASKSSSSSVTDDVRTSPENNNTTRSNRSQKIEGDGHSPNASERTSPTENRKSTSSDFTHRITCQSLHEANSSIKDTTDASSEAMPSQTSDSFSPIFISVNNLVQSTTERLFPNFLPRKEQTVDTAGSGDADFELQKRVKAERIVNMMQGNSSASAGADDDDPMNVSFDGTPSKRNKRKMTEPRRRTTDFSIRSICPDSDTEDNNFETMNTAAATAVENSHVKFNDIASMQLVAEPAARGLSFIAPPLATIPNLFRTMAVPSVGSLITAHLSFGSAPLPRRSSSADSVGSIADDASAGGAYNLDVNLATSSRGGGGGYQRSSDVTRVSSSSLSEERTTHREQFRMMSSSTSRGPSPDSQSASVYDGDSPPPHGGESGRRSRKNYKNMTKQRRIEANARERTRVHTISAAFESLRRAVPSYSYNQRLSKLAILRIACSYILALARLADLDYSEEQDGMSFSTCVDLCTQTIQAEGKAKRKH